MSGISFVPSAGATPGSCYPTSVASRRWRRSRRRKICAAPTSPNLQRGGSAPRESEDPLGDDVALDLGATAGDGVGEAQEVGAHPAASFLSALGVEDHAVGSEELHPQLVERLAELRGRQLEIGVLGCRAGPGEAGEALVAEGPQARDLLVGL